MTVTAAMVKELREKTGAGMMDSKKALEQCDGNMEKAMEFLRQKGIASAEKKMGRIAAEGRVGSYVDSSVGAMIEVNCETDFVAKNEKFTAFIDRLCKTLINGNATLGGSIYWFGTGGKVNRSKFYNNTASSGSAIYTLNSLEINNSEFLGRVNNA